MTNILLDSYAWIELLTGTEKGRKVKELNEGAEVYTTRLNLYEVYYRMIEIYGKPKADEFYEYMLQNAKIVELDDALVKYAADMKIGFKLPAIDSITYAAAKITNASVVSGCEHFKKIKGKDVIII